MPLPKNGEPDPSFFLPLTSHLNRGAFAEKTNECGDCPANLNESEGGIIRNSVLSRMDTSDIVECAILNAHTGPNYGSLDKRKEEIIDRIRELEETGIVRCSVVEEIKFVYKRS